MIRPSCPAAAFVTNYTRCRAELCILLENGSSLRFRVGALTLKGSQSGRLQPMDSPLALAQRSLLAPGGMSATDLERVFAKVMGPSIDAADLYFQHARSES